MSISYFYDLAKNYVNRTTRKLSSEKDEESRLPDLTTGEKRPTYLTGDTVKNGREYHLPEYIEMNSVKVSGRNRNETNPINTEAAVITLLNELKDHEKADRNFQNYIGYDSNGNIKVGKYEDFGPGDKMSGTYMNTVTSVSDRIKPSEKNRGRYQPISHVVEGQNKKEGSLNFLTEKDGSTNTYGSITGGRILVVPHGVKEATPILISGSIDDIRHKFEEIKQLYGVDSLDTYVLDNGTFNTGLRTFDQKLTTEDLIKYDRRNNGGGNFIYIKPEEKQNTTEVKRTESGDRFTSKPKQVIPKPTQHQPYDGPIRIQSQTGNYFTEDRRINPNTSNYINYSLVVPENERPKPKQEEQPKQEEKPKQDQKPVVEITKQDAQTFSQWFREQVKKGNLETVQEFKGKKYLITYGKPKQEPKRREIPKKYTEKIPQQRVYLNVEKPTISI